jgi:hypothetical protein
MGLKLKQMLLMVLFIIALIVVANAAENKWTIYKDQWIEDVLIDFPTKFCGSDQYFSQCYGVDQGKCEEAVKSACVVCISRYKDSIPNVLNQPADGKHWSQVISKCVGSEYDIALKEKRNKNEKCSNVVNWQ